jgi:hypothetical protein
MKTPSVTRTLSVFFFVAGAALANSTILATGVDSSRGGSFWIREDGADINAFFGGVIFITLTENGLQFNRDTLCVDLFTDINLGQTYNTDVLRPDQVPGKNLPRVSWLVDNALLPTEGSYSSLLPQDQWVRTAVQGIAIQLAIWDIVHDGGLEVNPLAQGRVQAAPGLTDPAVVQWTNAYLSVSKGKYSDLAYVYNNVDMGNGLPAQMLAGPMFADGGPTPSPAPEPSTFAAGAGLLTLLLTYCRRARRRATGVRSHSEATAAWPS